MISSTYTTRNNFSWYCHQNTEWFFWEQERPKSRTTNANHPNQFLADYFNPYKDFSACTPSLTPPEQQNWVVAPCLTSSSRTPLRKAFVTSSWWRSQWWVIAKTTRIRIDASFATDEVSWKSILYTWDTLWQANGPSNESMIYSTSQCISIDIQLPSFQLEKQ